MTTSVYRNTGLNDLFWSRLPNGVSVAGWFISNSSSALEPISCKRNDLFTVLSTSHSRLCGFLHDCRHDSLFVSRISNLQSVFETVLNFFASVQIVPPHPRKANFQRIFCQLTVHLKVTSWLPEMTWSRQNIIKDRWRNGTASNFYLCCSTDSSSGREKKALLQSPWAIIALN